VSDDPFDVDVCRWSGRGYWIVARQHEIYLKDLDSGRHTVSMDRWLVTSQSEKPSRTYIYSGIGGHTADLRKREGLVMWRLEPSRFRLLERNQ
jgi:hypothetical protein